MAFGEFAKPLVYITHYIIIISIFYIHAGITMPWALHNKTTAIWKLPLVVLIEVAAYLLCSYSNDLLLGKWQILPASSVQFTSQYASRNGYRALYFMGFSTGYYFLTTYLQERKKTIELERQKFNEIIYRQKAEQELTRAQNAFLKAQINPHFLFNTLDFIYHHILSVSPVAADAVIVLADMMRFAIDADKMGEFITLGDELDQVENLLHLNRLRKNEELPFTLAYSSEVRDIRLIPLVLLTLTENIFKHGNLSIGREASMKIHISDGSLIITTTNVNNRSGQDGHGTGLINTEKRLKYAYGEAIDFNYELDNDGYFRVFIKVPVDALQHVGPALPASEDIDTIPPHAPAALN